MAPATCDAETEQLRIELEECLLDGLVFISGTAVLKDPQGYRVAKKVAKVILGFAPVPLKILGYTGKPIGLLTSGHCVSLALQRARAVRRALEELGCRNNSAAKGMGHTDNLGARIEIVPCTEKEVEVVEGEVAAEEAGMEAAVRVPEASGNLSALLNGMITTKKRTGLEIVFEAPGGLQRTIFNRKPLGLSYQNDSPLVVTTVHPHGQAKVLGVQVGWEVRMIASRHVSHLDFTEVQEILALAVAKLPTAPGSPDNSELRLLKPISKCRPALAARVDETGDDSCNGSAVTRSHLSEETSSLNSATVDFQF